MADSNVRWDETTDVKIMSEKLSSKINDFQVIVLYNHYNHFDYNDFLNFPTDKIKKKVTSKVVFPKIESETFIVWQQSYEENKDLFFKLRLKARNELFMRVAEYLIARFLSEYENHLVYSIKKEPQLKWELLKKLFSKLESILKNDTFLAEENVWEEFSEWFRSYLMESTINGMMNTTGYHHLIEMDQGRLNNLFFQKMNRNLSENDEFMNGFTRVVNTYVEDWITKIINISDMKNMSVDHIMRMLHLNLEIKVDHHSKMQTKSDNLFVMSNAVYQTVRESISNKRFGCCSHSKWPKAILHNGSIKGNVQLIPYDCNEGTHKEQLQRVWEQAESFSELDVDVYDILCSFYLDKSRHYKDFVEVYLDDFLTIRGLKPKLGGGGRRGGYELKQRNQILKSLTKIRNLWINIEEVMIYEKGKPVQKSLQGRAFIFKDLNGNNDYFDKQSSKRKLSVKVGEAFESFLYGSGRQVKLLPIRALQYDPYREAWEKKLIRYLSWRWRTQARKGSYLQPHKISTLLEKIGVKINKRTPSRVRDRFEKALDVLQEDGVITSWQYENWDEDKSLKNGWLRIWKDSTLFITPPEIIVEHYQPLERKQTKKKNHFQPRLGIDGHQSVEDIGGKMKVLRINLGLTLQQVANEVEISVSYLSNIERGIKLPSANIIDRITNWMRAYNFN